MSDNGDDVKHIVLAPPPPPTSADVQPEDVIQDVGPTLAVPPTTTVASTSSDGPGGQRAVRRPSPARSVTPVRDPTSVLSFQVSTQYGRLAILRKTLEQAEQDSGKLVGAVSLDRIELQLEMLQQQGDQFWKAHEKMASLCTAEFLCSEYMTTHLFGTAFDTCIQAKQLYTELRTKVRNLIGPATTTASGTAHQSLPRIPLPKFSGEYADWKTFSDLFDNLIGKRQDLSSVEKLVRLKGALKGEAASLLGNVAVAEDNYEPAVRSLTERYDNRRLLVASHLNRLLKLAPVPNKSAKGLLTLVSTTKEVLDALKALGLPVEHWDCVVVHLLSRLIDSTTKEHWEVRLGSSQELPELAAFLEFLSSRARGLENVERESNAPRTGQSRPSRVHQASVATQGSTQGAASKNPSASDNCANCKGRHYIATCAKFLALSPAERRSMVEKQRLCYNCLGPHGANFFRSDKRCQRCEGKHHTLIHQGSPGDRTANTTSGGPSKPPSKPPDAGVAIKQPPVGTAQQIESRTQGLGTAKSHAACSPELSPSQLNDLPQAVILATARARAYGANGLHQSIRILVDPGSEISLITEKVASQLHLKRWVASVPIFGIGGLHSGLTKGAVTLELKSMFDDASVHVTAYILKTVTAAIPSLAFASDSRKLFRDLQLSDPTFYKRGSIEALIGADAYGRIIEPQIVKRASSQLIAQKTTLGWIVSGPLDGKSQGMRIHSTMVETSDNEQLTELLTKFWVREEIPAGPELQMSRDDLECENYFKATHSRDATGRYIVRLPFKGDRAAINSIGETLPAALRCLRRVTRRLETDAAYRTLYTDFLKEYEQMGHMEKVNETSDRNPSIYLPHHGVLREDHVTTKLRVVFNGSSRSSTGLSINQILHAGGKLQTDAPDVLLSLRRHRWAFGTDIVKMFRQIKVHPDDWDLQRIVWTDENGKLISYRLTTVTYGLTCAPWLSLRVLQQLPEDEGQRFPLAVPCITRSRYVDDIFGGSDSRDELKAIIMDLIGLCDVGGFPLQKWCSNCPQVLKEMGLQPSEEQTAPLDESVVSVLGMCWHPPSDTLRYKPKAFNATTFTKRSMLSEISQVYDPLGLISPIVIRAKILLQELWLLKVGWDDALPSSHVETWRNFRMELTRLEELSIPRWLQTFSGCPNLQIHGFSDASMSAMSAVVYLRTAHQGRAPTVSIMCAKTRVAPIKRMTIPRLELTAALMLAQLAAYAKRMLEVENLQLYLWTDSSVTLAWINSDPSRWKEFVRNRVAKIQAELTQGEWRHKNGKENPADCASRGVTTSELLSHPLWWTGPKWLSLPTAEWPTSTLSNPSEASLEAKAVHACVTLATDRQHSPPWELLGRYSRMSKLLQVTATIQRSVQRFRRKQYSSPVLDPKEIEAARLHWLKDTQQRSFGSVLRILTNSTVPGNHPLSRLTPFVDTDGVLRVGGRLKFSELSPEEKQPAIIPRHGPLTTLLIDEAHERTFHGGNQLTLAYLRQRYWIIGGRSSARSRLLKCVICTRQRGERAQQLMAQLPATRVTPSRPFLHSGVDYAGPFTVKTWRGRAAKTYKGYIAVFVCFSTSAVHLELVTDYSSDAFVVAYKRFTGRRGVCETLRSDRGTTLVGADKQLRQLFNQASADYQHLAASITSLGTRWIFNPPAAPHFGGKWEAAVKSVKYHMKRVIGDSTLTYEELTTLLVQIEAILNSRPLCPLSDDPADLTALTPGHFIIGEPLTALPEPRYDTDNISRLSRRQFIQSRIQLFWERWSAECLQRYQAISKWKHPSTQLKVGSMVLLTDERSPPSRWPLARVVQLHPGADGLTRVVDLRTSSTTLTRPVTKLCILPIDTTDTSLTGQ